MATDGHEDDAAGYSMFRYDAAGLPDPAEGLRRAIRKACHQRSLGGYEFEVLKLPYIAELLGVDDRDYCCPDCGSLFRFTLTEADKELLAWALIRE